MKQKYNHNRLTTHLMQGPTWKEEQFDSLSEATKIEFLIQKVHRKHNINSFYPSHKARDLSLERIRSQLIYVQYFLKQGQKLTLSSDWANAYIFSMPFLPHQINFIYDALYVKLTQDFKFYAVALKLENLLDEERKMIELIQSSLKNVFNVMYEAKNLSESNIKNQVIHNWNNLLLSENIIYITLKSLQNFYGKYWFWLNKISSQAIKEGAVLRLFDGSEEIFYQQFYKVYANLQKALSNQLLSKIKKTTNHLEWTLLDMFKSSIIKWKDLELFIKTLSPEIKTRIQRYYKLIRQ